MSRTSSAASRLACVSTASTSSALACSAVSPAVRSSTAAAPPRPRAVRCLALDVGRDLGELAGPFLQAARIGIEPFRTLGEPLLAALEILALRAEVGTRGPQLGLGAEAELLGVVGHLRGALANLLGLRMRARPVGRRPRSEAGPHVVGVFASGGEGDVRQRVTAVRTGSHDVRRMARPA